MSKRVTTEVLGTREEIVAAPAVPVARACEDQNFGLPTGLYVAMALMFAGFIVVLSFAFRDGMAVSFGVIFAFLAAFFAVPAIFPRVAANSSRTKPLDWIEFRYNGVATETGHSSGPSATVLVLLLPFLILCFAIAIAAIVALV